MRLSSVSLLFLFIVLNTLCIKAQNCDYNYTSGMVLYDKNRVLDKAGIEKSRKRIIEYKACLDSIPYDATKHYWLHHAIARELSEQEVRPDSIGIHAKLAFEAKPSQFCEEYITHAVYIERDSTFPMKSPYLDRLHTNSANTIKAYCVEHYKQAELDKYKKQEERLAAERSSSSFNQAYSDALKAISIKDQQERKQDHINWEKQNQLDAENRKQLNALYEKYGFPTRAKVSSKGIMNAFMVLHHSTDYDWNEKWTERFLAYNDDLKADMIFHFYFYRNFNKDDGSCKDNVEFLDRLRQGKHAELAKKYLDFTVWEKRFKKNK